MGTAVDRDTQDRVREYILDEWDKTTRSSDDAMEAGPGSGRRLRLPEPYTVPCAEDRFQELYYWDTYFANLGLLRSGRVQQAQNNVDNFLYEVASYGFVPNSNATYHLNRSQPPFLALMVRDIYDTTGDIGWVTDRLDGVEAEYQFWMRERSTETGLNRYYHRATEEEKAEFYDSVLVRRLGFEGVDEATKRAVSDHYIAEAESGHDFTPRFQGRCADFAPVDLNSLLSCYENMFGYFAERTSWGDVHRWEDAWTLRRRRIDDLLWDGTRYADYNTVTGRHSPVLSTASLYPLWVGLATNEQAAAMVSALQALDAPSGIVTCPQLETGPAYQWGYPNGWPPMQYAVVQALRRYGYGDRARHIAGKYLQVVSETFESTGNLWEKYDVVAGGPAAGEYEATRMMGWTAGVFQALYEFYWSE